MKKIRPIVHKVLEAIENQRGDPTPTASPSNLHRKKKRHKRKKFKHRNPKLRRIYDREHPGDR